MAKHTHTGTCQACGRVQAVTGRGGRIASHGYTIEHGWQSGTCAGSGELPLEVSREFADRTIDSLTVQAEKWFFATREDITTVDVSYRPAGPDGRRPAVDKKLFCLNAADFAAEFPLGYVPRWDSPTRTRPGETFDDLRDRAAQLRRNAVPQIRDHIRFLRELIGKRHGQPLYPALPDVDPQLDVVKREAGDYRRVRELTAELEAQGYKVSSRRRHWRQGGGFSVTGKRVKAGG